MKQISLTNKFNDFLTSMQFPEIGELYPKIQTLFSKSMQWIKQVGQTCMNQINEMDNNEKLSVFFILTFAVSASIILTSAILANHVGMLIGLSVIFLYTILLYTCVIAKEFFNN